MKKTLLLLVVLLSVGLTAVMSGCGGGEVTLEITSIYNGSGALIASNLEVSPGGTVSVPIPGRLDLRLSGVKAEGDPTLTTVWAVDEKAYVFCVDCLPRYPAWYSPDYVIIAGQDGQDGQNGQNGNVSWLPWAIGGVAGLAGIIGTVAELSPPPPTDFSLALPAFQDGQVAYLVQWPIAGGTFEFTLVNSTPPPIGEGEGEGEGEPIDHAPTANNQPNLSTPYGVALPVTLTGSDPDGDALTFLVKTNPRYGTLDDGDAPYLVYDPGVDSSGIYDTFTFQVSDGRGGIGIGTITINVGKAPPVIVPTTVSLSPNQTSGQASLTVSFTATADCDPTRTISSYAWDFGGGFAAGTSTATRQYTTAGTYTATVKVTDSAGGTAQSSVTITVTASGILPTKVLITADKPIGNAPLPVSFTATSSCDPTRTITGYYWDFGGGLVAGTDHATHTYTTPGTYSALCKVIDSEGGFAISTFEVVVQ
ncbi:MAG: PKD domain-containing protein [Candidatus Staskawiczbacteria bacterium]|nr:PKD domain-containing protein [Candidatus Staskawiczbacteria bacterium]